MSIQPMELLQQSVTFHQVHSDCICRKSELSQCVSGGHLAVLCLLDVLSMQVLTDCVWSEGKLMRGKGDRELGELCVCVCVCVFEFVCVCVFIAMLIWPMTPHFSCEDILTFLQFVWSSQVKMLGWALCVCVWSQTPLTRLLTVYSVCGPFLHFKNNMHEPLISISSQPCRPIQSCKNQHYQNFMNGCW